MAKETRTQLAVRDMGKALRNSTRKPEHASQAITMFDRVQLSRPLGGTLGAVTKIECHWGRDMLGGSSGARRPCSSLTGRTSSQMVGEAYGCY